jgi:hypothetical protein
MVQRHLILSCFALTVALSGCSGSSSNVPINYTPENLGLDPLDQVIPLSDQDHRELDSDFMTYLQGLQQAGDDGNWQANPYDHYMSEGTFK